MAWLLWWRVGVDFLHRHALSPPNRLHRGRWLEKTCFSGRQSCSTSLARTFRQAWAVWFNSLLITDIIYYIEYRIAQIFQLEVIFYLCAVSDSPRRTQSCSGSTDRSSDCVCVCVCVCMCVCLSVCVCVCWPQITTEHRQGVSAAGSSGLASACSWPVLVAFLFTTWRQLPLSTWVHLTTDLVAPVHDFWIPIPNPKCQEGENLAAFLEWHGHPGSITVAGVWWTSVPEPRTFTGGAESQRKGLRWAGERTPPAPCRMINYI